MWSGPFQIAVAIGLLSQTLGPAFFSGLAVILAMIPFSGAISSLQARALSHNGPTAETVPLETAPLRKRSHCSPTCPAQSLSLG